MSRIHLLGTGAALSDPGRTTTMLALESQSVILIDCGGDAIHRLLAAGLDLDRLAAVILSHEHPDHVGGFPLLMEKIWLAQRRRPLPVSGPQRALEQARKLFESFDTSGWTGMPAIDWRPVDLEQGAPVWRDDSWDVIAAPGVHSVPVIGVRATERSTGRCVCYSADTEPADAIRELAAGADLLIHEATGGLYGHTEASDAAAIAKQAGVGSLYLVHLPPDFSEQSLDDARAIFPRTEAGRDGQVVDLV